MSWPRPGPGRPRTYGHNITVTVDDETDAAIRRYAEAGNATLADALRELLQYGLESAHAEA
jgi:hypothetical protein